MPWKPLDEHDNFPTLGWYALDWIYDNLTVHDGPSVGEPLQFTQEQADFILRFYEVDPNFVGPATHEGERFMRRGRLVRRALLSRSKGWGKSPLVAAICLLEALGDVVMDGWDAAGQPVGRPWRDIGLKPLVQILGVSEEATINTWGPCIDMARNGPVYDNYDIEPMETFVNVPRGRIQAVTSAALSREGFRPVFSACDQALALDTPIPTPDGWRDMGDLEAGDLVFGSDGQAVRISEAKPTSWEHDCYRVRFSDGTSVVASGGHLWMSRRGNWPEKWDRVRTTVEMMDGYRYRVPAAPPRRLPEAEQLAHPYLLGIWLGDGTRGKCEIAVGEADCPALRENLAAIGVETWERRYARKGGAIPAVNLSFTRLSGYQGSTRPNAAKAIAALPCYLDKHIPVQYLHASIEQRTQLLRGLMDSDGHVSKTGACTFISTNRRLAEGFVELIRSLGQITSGAIWIEDDRYTGGGKYRISFTPRGGLVPVALPRKVARVRQHSNSPDWITIVSIEPIERVAVRCIAVESDDHLFAFGEGGHLTHNTEGWLPTNGGVRLYRTVRRNTAKTGGSTIETPNAFEPGEESVAEATWMAYQQLLKGKTRSKKRDFFVDHREASATTDIYDEASLRRGLIEAYGDSAAENGGWVNMDNVIDEFWDPNTDTQEARRYFLNQITHASDSFLSSVELAACVEPKAVDMGTPIVLGFDGSMGRVRGKADATALVACRLSDGYCWQVLIREPPSNPKDARNWTAPVFEFDTAVQQMFRDFKVVGFYADPSGWEAHVSRWEELHGRKLKVRAGGEGNHPIMAWPRGKTTSVVPYLKRVKTSILTSGEARIAALAAADGNKDALKGVGEFTYCGSMELTQHLLNARMRQHPTGYLLAKDFPESPRKIDGAYALVLAWKARLDAVSRGLDKQLAPSRRVVTLG